MLTSPSTYGVWVAQAGREHGDRRHSMVVLGRLRRSHQVSNRCAQAGKRLSFQAPIGHLQACSHVTSRLPGWQGASGCPKTLGRHEVCEVCCGWLPEGWASFPVSCAQRWRCHSLPVEACCLWQKLGRLGGKRCLAAWSGATASAVLRGHSWPSRPRHRPPLLLPCLRGYQASGGLSGGGGGKLGGAGA